MSHPTIQELTEAVHGLRPPLEHLEECPDCRQTREALLRELGLLRRAEARVRVPARRSWRGSRMPLAAAAAAVLALTCWIALENPRGTPGSPPRQEKVAKLDDLLLAFLEGNEEESLSARNSLRKRSAEALPLLLEARGRRKPIRRPDALSSLILDLKEKEAGPAMSGLFKNLKELKISMDMQDASLEACLTYIRALTDLNVTADPELNPGKLPVSLKMQDVSLAQAFDLLDSAASTEYDVRYGTLFLARPARLSALPRQGHWRKQELGEEGKGIVAKLGAMKMTLDFESVKLEEVLDFLRTFSGLNIVVPAHAGIDPKMPVTYRVKDLLLGSVLEGLLLPRGLDLNIEGNVLQVVAAQK